MKKGVMRHGVIGMMALAGLIVSGCSIGGLFLKDHDFAAKESWEVKAPPADLFEAIADTGRSMGFDISYWEMRNPPPGLEYWESVSPPPVDKNDGRFRSIILSHDHLNGLKATFLGYRNASGLTFYAWQGGAYMEVYAMVDGDLGSGTQKAAMKLLSNFRKKLSEKVGEIAVVRVASAADFRAAAVPTPKTTAP
jgi:hypothetical protein